MGGDSVKTRVRKNITTNEVITTYNLWSSTILNAMR